VGWILVQVRRRTGQGSACIPDFTGQIAAVVGQGVEQFTTDVIENAYPSWRYAYPQDRMQRHISQGVMALMAGFQRFGKSQLSHACRCFQQQITTRTAAMA